MERFGRFASLFDLNFNLQLFLSLLQALLALDCRNFFHEHCNQELHRIEDVQSIFRVDDLILLFHKWKFFSNAVNQLDLTETLQKYILVALGLFVCCGDF